jgi:hypothetical protein
MIPKSKIEVIDKIRERHPSRGVEKGWSEYTGGMADTGRWFFRKMLDVDETELHEFLGEILLEESIPPRVLTKQEEIDSKIIIPMPNGGFMTKLCHQNMEQVYGNLERNWLFGK